jgi:hypothetical protein
MFVPEVCEDTLPPLGLFFVTAVEIPETRFDVVQVTLVSLHVEALFAMVQFVADIVPEGEVGAVTTRSGPASEQLLFSFVSLLIAFPLSAHILK